MKVLAWTVIGAGLVGAWPGPALFPVPGRDDPVDLETAPPAGVAPSASDGAAWLQRMKPWCNAVEVEWRVAREPAPGTWDGRAHEAVCFALAGRIDRARSILDRLPGDQQWKAAGVVFDAAHPVADAGNDVAAGPLMELVVEFWPNHYMALYHAGAARYALGDQAEARDHLRRFLAEYDTDDGWRRNARVMLEAMGR